MKRNLVRLALAVAVASTLSASAQTKEFKSKPCDDTKARLEGTSNIHDWWVEGKLISGLLKIDDAAVAKGTPGKVEASVKVIIPVKSLHSSSGAPMDDVMYDHYEVDKDPANGKITYELKELTCKGPGEFISKGDLTMHGVTSAIEMPVKIQKVEDDLKITGSVKTKMTTFKIEPPAPKIAMGMIKTGDDVTVNISWRVTPVAK